MGDVIEATGKVRMNFASQHLFSARNAALRIYGVEQKHAPGYDSSKFGAFFEPIMEDASTTVFCAVAALDAYLNEVAFDSERSFPGQPIETVKLCIELIERKPIPERMRLLPLLKGNQPPDPKSEQVKSILVLLRLRNALVHFAPEWLGEDAKHVPLSKSLDDLKPPFTASPFLDKSEQTFPRRWMSYSAAKWAVELVRDFVIELATTNGWRCDYQQHSKRLELP